MTSGEFEFQPLAGPDWRTELRARGSETWHRVTSPRLTTDVVIRLGLRTDGRLACTGVMLGAGDDTEVTARALRTIPLGEIMTAVATYVAGEGTTSGSPLERAIMRHYAKLHLVDSAGTAAEIARPARPGPAGHDDAHYQRVAALYRDALVRAPRAATKHVADQMHAEPRTVQRWLKTARDRGILGASTPGMAGETRGER